MSEMPDAPRDLDERARPGQASRTYCRSCRRLTVDSLVEQYYAVVPKFGAPIDVPDPLPLFAVDAFERRAIAALPIPDHPHTTFDEDHFRTLLASNTTLSGHEKLDLLLALPHLPQERLDRLIAILWVDHERTERLNRERREWVAEQDERFRAAIDDLAAKGLLFATLPDGIPREPALTPSDRAVILRKGIAPLLAFLGPGTARATMASVLGRIADRVAMGERSELLGLLPELFAEELAHVLVSTRPALADPRPRLPSLISTTLSRLRTARPETLVEHQRREYVVSLVIEGPGVSHGRVAQVHRIALQIQPDYANTIDSYRYRHIFMPAFFRLVGHGPHDEALPSERFGPLGHLVTRLVALRGYAHEGERRELLLRAALILLERLLPILQFDEKARFLATLIDVPLQPATQRSERFDDWFLRAIGRPADCDAEFEPFVRAVSALEELYFHEKVAVIGQFRLLHPDSLERTVLMEDVRRALETRTDGRELMVEARPVELQDVLRERVLHPDDFVAALEAHISNLLGHGAVPQSPQHRKRRHP